MSDGRRWGANFLQQKDLISGLLFAAIGIGFALGGAEYGIGDARRMGPGYFPVMIGGVLAFIGVGLVVKAILAKVSDPVPPIYLRPLLALVASVFAFGFLIQRAGLVAACLAVVMIAGLATPATRWIETTIIAIAMTLFSVLVFVQFLGLPLRLWTW